MANRNTKRARAKGFADSGKQTPIFKGAAVVSCFHSKGRNPGPANKRKSPWRPRKEGA